MKVRVSTYEDGTSTIFTHWPGVSQHLIALTEHDLRDLEFVLAQRRAMARRCEDEHGEHTCSLAPGHGGTHLCRACTEQWRSS